MMLPAVKQGQRAEPSENSLVSLPSTSLPEALDCLHGVNQAIDGVTLDEIVAPVEQVQELIQHLSSLQTALANLVAAKRLVATIKGTVPAQLAGGRVEAKKESPQGHSQGQENNVPNNLIAFPDHEEKPLSVKNLHPGVPLRPVEILRAGPSSTRDREPTKSPTAAAVGVGIVPLRFFDRMIDNLAACVGPMACVMIRDHVRDLGESLAAFLPARLGELLELVSREIPDKRPKVSFQQQMSEAIRSFKLF